jgi:hypothetical protein
MRCVAIIPADEEFDALADREAVGLHKGSSRDGSGPSGTKWPGGPHAPPLVVSR